MDDFEKEMEEYRRKKEEERLAFLKKCANKVKDNDSLIYRLLALGLSQRFKIKLRWDGEPQYIVYPILKYYTENIDIGWDEWLESDDAPMIKPIREVKRIFPELAEITDDESEIVDLANKLYGLELYTDDDSCNSPKYFYAYSFDFNTFKPINVKEIKELKIEREVLSKYGYDTTGIDEKLSGFGLTEEQLKEL